MMARRLPIFAPVTRENVLAPLSSKVKVTSNLPSYKKSILDLKARKKIYNIVKRYAGTHFRKIERLSKFPTGHVKYHLDYLAKHELIRAEKKDNNIRYFPKKLRKF